MDENADIEISLSDNNDVDIAMEETMYINIDSQVIEEMQEDIAELQADSGASIVLSINSSTYVMTLQLKNKAGTVVSSGSIDLPLESMIINGTYDDQTKKLILTLQSGNTIEISLADIISGLENASNKVTTLSSSSTDTQYPSAKCVYDLIGDIESALEELDTGGGVQ